MFVYTIGDVLFLVVVATVITITAGSFIMALTIELIISAWFIIKKPFNKKGKLK